MHFEIEHRFPAPPRTVADALVDPDLVLAIELPDLALPDLLAHADDGTAARLELHYEYVGQLDPIVRRLLGRRKLTFLQELQLDRDALTGTLSLAVEADPDRVRGDANVALAADGDSTVRRITGEFVVRVPLVGGTAEGKILPGVLRRFDAEAAAVAEHLDAAPY